MEWGERRSVTGSGVGSVVGEPWFKGVSMVIRPAKSLARERGGGAVEALFKGM